MQPTDCYFSGKLHLNTLQNQGFILINYFFAVILLYLHIYLFPFIHPFIYSSIYCIKPHSFQKGNILIGWGFLQRCFSYHLFLLSVPQDFSCFVLQVTLIPTHDSEVMREWYQDTHEKQQDLNIMVLASSSTVVMQDESFPACKIEL